MRVTLRHTIILFVVVGLGGWYLFSQVARHRQATLLPHTAHYAELTEINRDQFPRSLFSASSDLAAPQFYLHDGIIIVDKEEVVNPQKVKLFLVHKVIFEGTGRHHSSYDYYTFRSFPAEVALPSLNIADNHLKLSLDDSVGRTLEIRLFRAEALTLVTANGKSLHISYNDKDHTIRVGKEKSLSSRTQQVKVSQDLFTPIPKGAISESDIRVDTIAYGQVRFSTELKILNHGKHEVRLS